VVAVKTAAPIPKGKIFEVMKEINRAVAPAGVRIGDVVIENVSGTGVSIVATSNG
jgi:CxxC motif-containing protein